jgi:hypothetical protein
MLARLLQRKSWLEGEKIKIIDARDFDEESEPPFGYILRGKHDADIEGAGILPLGRLLTRDMR